MKKILKLLLSLTSVIIVSANSLIIISCTNQANTLTQNDYVSMYKKYFYGYPLVSPTNPYFSFISDYTTKTSVTASTTSMKSFDDLQINPIWNSFSDLTTDLTTTKLSNQVTTNVDWNNLYTQAGLNPTQINEADNLQLSFYNTIAKVYQKSNILRLVQKITLAPTGSTVVAYNSYYSYNNPSVASQSQTYGPNFVNQNLIDQEYNHNFWNSNHLNAVSVHEYGHALSNYIAFPPRYRKNFNIYYVPSTTLNQNMLGRPSAYSDITQILMDYLDTKITINATSTADEEIKNFLFPLIVVKSGYSNVSFSTGDISQRNEFLAEAFSLWLGTDNNKRTWSWELLNDFFMNYLPTYGSLNI